MKVVVYSHKYPYIYTCKKEEKKIEMERQFVTLTIDEYGDLMDELKLKDKQIQENEARHKSKENQYKEREIQYIEKEIQYKEEINRLRWEILWYQRRMWGKSSEKHKLPEDPEELKQCFESTSNVTDPAAEEAKAKEEAKKSEDGYTRFRKSYTKKVTPHARKPIPERIPREDIIVPMPEGTNLEGAVKIGEEITEQYAVHPRILYVRRIIRPKYKLADGRIVTAPMPPMAHPHSNASESVLSHIAVLKYSDHLPLNRQIEIFEREGIHLSPSTLSNWMMATAQRIEPIYNELRETVKKSYYVMADETPEKVLESSKPGALHQGYMWNFYLPDKKTPYFEYHKGRGAEGIETLLDGEVKVVQSDGYRVYFKFDELPDRIHLCCWAHVRRKFEEAGINDPQRSAHALNEIALLYKTEKEIKEKGLSGKAIVELRRKESYPVIKKLEQWCKDEYLKTKNDSPIAKAMAYMFSRFEQLSFYVNDSRLQIDNNPVERSIRPLTLHRKNCLFAGSHEAAHSAAIFFSLLGCCREHNIDPKKWMEDVLIRVQDKKYERMNDYSELLPYNWIEKYSSL